MGAAQRPAIATGRGQSAALDRRLRVDPARVGLAAILVLAALLRFTGTDWDGGRGFDPDERQVAAVAARSDWPSGLRGYFDTAASPLNPVNQGFDAAAAPTVPIVLVKAIGALSGDTTDAGMLRAARRFAALSDLLTILLVFLIALHLFDERTALVAALLSALTPLQVQLAHRASFGTYAAAACLATFFFALRATRRGQWWDHVLAGVGAALAFAAADQMLPVLALTALPLAEHLRVHGWRRVAGRSNLAGVAPLLGLVVALLAAAWTFRLAQPYAFFGPSPFSFRLDPIWTDGLRRLREIRAGIDAGAEGAQWSGRTPVLAVVREAIRWGFGPPLGIAAVGALLLTLGRFAVARRMPPAWQLALAGWPLLLVALNGLAFAQPMAALLPAYPFLVLLAAALLVRAWEIGAASAAPARRWAGLLPLPAVLLLAAAYALAVTGLYTGPSTRAAASVWFVEHAPDGAVVLAAEGDVELPLDNPGYPVERIAFLNLDDSGKRDALVQALDRATYIVVTGDRVAYAAANVPEKYPMTLTYARMLASGELGFALDHEASARPELLGLTLDGADPPASIDDQPTIRIYRKTAAYDRAAVLQRLDAALAANPAIDLDPTLGGRDGALLSEAERVTQQAGGTWSAIFHRGDLANRHPVVVWYLALQLMALLAVPLCWRVLGGLPDRGYAVAKFVGLLLTVYVAWLLPSLKLMSFGRGAVLLGLAALAAISLTVAGRRWRALLADLWARRADLLAAETVFLVAFAAFVWVRSQNPDLWHPYRGGEKPMEFAYFNAVIRSTHFPPYDPWFAGGSINYYYFGYVLMAAVTRFTGVIPSVAFNLAVPTLFALTVLNAWAFVRNALGLLRIGFGERTRWLLPVAALTGPLFVVGLGNLDLARRIGRGEYGYGNAAGEGALDRGSLLDILRGVGRAIFDRHAVPTDTFWAPSRVIPDTVNEFPAFTFLFADFHPHMVGLAATSATLVIALAVLQARRWPTEPAVPVAPSARLFADRSSLRRVLAGLPRGIGADRALLVAFVGLVTGALYPLNTWDFPTFVAVVCGAYALLELAAAGASGDGWRFTFPAVRRVALWSLATVAIGRLAFAPYFAHYVQPNSGFVAWDGTRATTAQYVDIHGILLFFVVSYLLTELWLLYGRGALPVATVRRIRTIRRPNERTIAVTIGRARLAFPAAYPFAAIVAIAAALGLFGGGLLWLHAALLLLTALVAVGRRNQPVRLFLCGLVGVAVGLGALVERYALRGDIGRFNTVFKFYLQAWLLLALVAAIGLVVLLAEHRTALPRVGRVAWSAVAALLLLAGLAYPAVAGPGRLNDRFLDLPPTLDGMAYMRFATYDDATPDNSEIRPYALVDDYDAITWLLDNVQGSPVVLEGNTNLYRWGSRVSVYTGLPDVIGWDWHQTQQRAGYGPVIDQRKRDVAAMLGAPSFDAIAPLLARYHVRYIYVGPLERIYYPPAGLAKFDAAVAAGQLTVAYRNPGVTIYQVMAAGTRG